jgi:hypothetical protein
MLFTPQLPMEPTADAHRAYRPNRPASLRRLHLGPVKGLRLRRHRATSASPRPEEPELASATNMQTRAHRANNHSPHALPFGAAPTVVVRGTSQWLRGGRHHPVPKYPWRRPETHGPACALRRRGQTGQLRTPDGHRRPRSWMGLQFLSRQSRSRSTRSARTTIRLCQNRGGLPPPRTDPKPEPGIHRRPTPEGC